MSRPMVRSDHQAVAAHLEKEFGTKRNFYGTLIPPYGTHIIIDVPLAIHFSVHNKGTGNTIYIPPGTYCVGTYSSSCGGAQFLQLHQQGSSPLDGAPIIDCCIGVPHGLFVDWRGTRKAPPVETSGK